MFILARRNILLPTADHSETFRINSGDLVEVPDRFCETAYFRALVKDGKIAVPETRKDQDIIQADETAETVVKTVQKRVRKAKN